MELLFGGVIGILLGGWSVYVITNVKSDPDSAGRSAHSYQDDADE